jgi:hypothetical protein
MVLGGIVERVPVDVVNHLVPGELPAESGFHHVPMLSDLYAVHV